MKMKDQWVFEQLAREVLDTPWFAEAFFAGRGHDAKVEAVARALRWMARKQWEIDRDAVHVRAPASGAPGWSWYADAIEAIDELEIDMPEEVPPIGTTLKQMIEDERHSTFAKAIATLRLLAADSTRTDSVLAYDNAIVELTKMQRGER